MITYKQLLSLLEDYRKDWLKQQEKTGKLTPETKEEHENGIDYFHKNKRKLPAELRDISKHPDLESIKKSFETLTKNRLNDSLQKRHESATPEERKGAETIHNSNGIQVQHIKTEAASKHYGSGTKCCTAERDKNQFDYYTKIAKGEGNLYIIHGKDEKGEPHRYTIIPHVNEWRDEINTQLGAQEIVRRNPQLKNVKKLQGEHPELTSDKNFDEHVHKMLEKLPVDTSSDPRFKKEHLNNASEEAKKEVASNRGAHPDILHHLATDKKSSLLVRQYVSSNYNTHSTTLHDLATDERSSDMIKSGVAKNKNTREDTLHHLAMDKNASEDVKRRVAAQENTHPDTLHYLATHPDSSDVVKDRAKNNPNYNKKEGVEKLRPKYLNTKY